MAAKNTYSDGTFKLSLLAQHDDIIRMRAPLEQGTEADFSRFLKNQKRNLHKWSDAQKEIDKLKDDLRKSKIEKEIFENRWKHMKSLFESETLKKSSVEKERKSLERQIALIKEVLLNDQALNDQTREKLAFLRTNTRTFEQDSPRHLDTIVESMGSLLSPSDMSFDKTDEDLDDLCPAPNANMRRSRSKRSRVDDFKNGSKKPRFNGDSIHGCDSSTSHCADELMEFSREINSILAKDLEAHSRTRSFSEPTPSSDLPPLPRQICKSDNDVLDDGFIFNEEQNYRAGGLTVSTPLRRLSSTGRMNRNHIFCTKTIIRPESCFPCGHRIKFYKQALKCQDCRVVCHTECKDKVPLPCYPTMQTPTGKGVLGKISDFVPAMPPFVPPLIVHCLSEIESRGLTEIGLYRVSGSEREVKDLKEAFLRGKSLPCLSRMDVHAVCGAVKEFLRSLHEPLITKSLWHDFVRSSELHIEKESFSAVFQAIGKLPQANKDTLAYLIIHLKSVAESPKCKMPVENIAKVFGPTIVGYSSSEPSNADIISQTKCQCKVVETFMKLPLEYWNSLIAGDETSLSNIPKMQSVKSANRLGPLTSYRSKGILLGKTPLTPRHGRSGTMKAKPRLMPLPILK